MKPTEPAISSGLRPIRSDRAPNGGMSTSATTLAMVIEMNASILVNPSVLVK